MARIFVIGIGYKPLDKRATGIIANSKVILASDRLLDVFARYEEYELVKDRLKVNNSITETIDFMKILVSDDPASHITLLASGDPMFFGIGRRAVEEFGKDMVEIIPDLSSIQQAFSRIKEPWDDALFISLHGGPDPNRRRKLEYSLRDIPSLLEKHNKIAVLTDGVNNPSVIAQTLIDSAELSGLPAFELKLHVCEKLGYPDERITEGTPREIAAQSFSDPNVVIIRRGAEARKCGSIEGKDKKNTSIKFGLREDEIIHSRGLITKDEARAATIHKLRLPERGILWDIGAGSGSLSIETARLCPGLKVFAVEKDEEQIKNISANKEKFSVTNMEIINGLAPDALGGLPSPDRVIIGGSGGKIVEIIRTVGNRMQAGIVVINAATLETLNKATDALREAHYAIEVFQISVSKMKQLGDSHTFSAQNPIFVIKGEKQISSAGNP